MVTAVLGLAAKVLGLELPETVTPVVVALMVGAIVILIVEAWSRRARLSNELTWRVVLFVGLAQVVAAIFPGTSRSGAAMVAALLAGLTDRRKAAEFAFLVGIPTMLAATGFELLKAMKSGSALHENWSELLLPQAQPAVVTGAANFNESPQDGIERNIAQARRGTQGIAFRDALKDFCLNFQG